MGREKLSSSRALLLVSWQSNSVLGNVVISGPDAGASFDLPANDHRSFWSGALNPKQSIWLTAMSDRLQFVAGYRNRSTHNPATN